MERLNAAGVPSGPIYDIDQMFADPQVEHVRMAVPMPHPTRRTRASSTRRWHCRAPPVSSTGRRAALGEHSEEILTELGYSANDIKALRSKKVI